MSKKKFRVDVKLFENARKICGVCGECYIEQLWRDIGDNGACHCSRTRTAFSNAMRKVINQDLKDELPQKDVEIIAELKTGQHVCVKLFYDNENKPCMYYDGFDNWYAISDITFLDFVMPKYIDIEVDDK